MQKKEPRTIHFKTKDNAKKQSQREMELLDKVNQLTESLKRSQADFINYKKRNETEQESFVKYANASLLEQIIPIFDQLNTAMNAMPETAQKDTWAEGVSQIVRLFEKKLEEIGVKRIETIGKLYHPEFHEAVMRGEGKEKDIILEEFEAGYLYHDKVLRPAKVKVCTDVI